MIQLFVVAGVYGFALFENRETQTRWLAFADLAFVRVFLSYSSEIRLNHPVVFHVKHCGVDRFAGWLFESVVSSLLVVGGWCFTWNSCGYGFGGVVGNWGWGF